MIIKSNGERDRDRLPLLVELRDGIETVKTTVWIANEVKAFHTFSAFSTAVEG